MLGVKWMVDDFSFNIKNILMLEREVRKINIFAFNFRFEPCYTCSGAFSYTLHNL